MGGAGLPAGPILIVAAVVVLLLGLFVVVPWMRSDKRRTDRATDPQQETLEYRVPPGQDPAAVVHALRQDGIEAVTSVDHGDERVVIPAKRGVETVRERARQTILNGALNIEDQQGAEQPHSAAEVRFVDE